MKDTKAVANYRDARGVRRCENCTMFRPPDACTSVQGDISPDAVCDYFERVRRLSELGS